MDKRTSQHFEFKFVYIHDIVYLKYLVSHWMAEEADERQLGAL